MFIKVEFGYLIDRQCFFQAFITFLISTGFAQKTLHEPKISSDVLWKYDNPVN